MKNTNKNKNTIDLFTFKKTATLLLAACLFYAIALPWAAAAVIKSTQYGTVILAADQSSITDTLSQAVDMMSKSFFVFGVSENSNSPGQGQISSQITTADTIIFQRDASTGAPAITIKWYEAEFNSRVSVQRGGKQTPSAPNQTDDLVTLSKGVDIGKSVPIISYGTDGVHMTVKGNHLTTPMIIPA